MQRLGMFSHEHSIAAGSFGINPQQFYTSNIASKASMSHISKHYSTFARQEHAFRYFDLMTKYDQSRSKLFCYESIATGRRTFLVSDFFTFRDEYFRTPSADRHVYEIIREGSPCRLYFDLEFSKSYNRGVDGDLLLDEFIQMVAWKLHAVYGLFVSSEHIVVLDSSHSEKFSKHVTFVLTESVHIEQQGAAVNTSASKMKVNTFPTEDPASNGTEFLFANNIEVGKFVQQIILDITTTAESAIVETTQCDALKGGNGLRSFVQPGDSCSSNFGAININGYRRVPKKRYSHFWLYTEESKEGVVAKSACFVDMGVYTRNRYFRLFGSCKHGKTTCLKVVPREAKKYFSPATVAMTSSVAAVVATQHNTTTQGTAHSNTVNKTKALKPLQQMQFETLLQSLIVPLGMLFAAQDDSFRNSLAEEGQQQIQKSLKRPRLAENGTENNTRITNGRSVFLLPNLDSAVCKLDGVDRSGTCSLTVTGAVPEAHSYGAPGTTTHLQVSTTFSRARDIGGGGWQDRRIAASTYLRQPSWFPQLDRFVEKFIRDREASTCNSSSCSTSTSGDHLSYKDGYLGCEGEQPPHQHHHYNQRTNLLNSWVLYSTAHRSFPRVRIRYQVATSHRYCANVGRPHKSNGIIIEADLMERVLFQTCWDSECTAAGFQSLPVPIPEQLDPPLPGPEVINEMVADFKLLSNVQLVERAMMTANNTDNVQMKN